MRLIVFRTWIIIAVFAESVKGFDTLFLSFWTLWQKKLKKTNEVRE